MQYYIYSCKLHSQAITLEGFKDDTTLKYQIESFSQLHILNTTLKGCFNLLNMSYAAYITLLEMYF